MAKKSPSSAGGADPGGAGQAVVELCGATPEGMIFWSRQRFEIGAELQVRVRAEALPPILGCQTVPSGGWANLVGYVVQCQAERRADGSFGFRVSLLLQAAIKPNCKKPPSLHPTADVFCDASEGRGRLRIGKN